MDRQNGKYFTIFYGVFRATDRALAYCNAGHPPGLLFTGPTQDAATLRQLEPTDTMVGVLPPGVPFETQTAAVDRYARLLVYSDGVFEIDKPAGGMWQHPEFVDFLARRAVADDLMDQLYAHVKELRGGAILNDDFSICDVRWH
jgi:sigma-B regulation protein RsbU (phosphoserine phosphatase)